MRAMRWFALFVITLYGCANIEGQTDEAITQIKDYQRSLGLKPTKNFRRHTSRPYAEYRCYYAGKLDLPATYDELRFKRGSAKGCRIDTGKYDVFFYPMEAAATGKVPVTASLAESSPERLAMVVIHEDFHQGHEESKLPPSVTEAASTLMGFILSAEFAERRFEQASRDADLFLEKARIVNRYREEAAELYASVQAGRLTREAALKQKDGLFRSLEKDCRNLSAEPATFDNCPGAFNNAGLAFDYTYTKHYPLLYALYEAGSRDVQATLRRIQEVLSMPLRTEEQFEHAVNAFIATLSPR